MNWGGRTLYSGLKCPRGQDTVTTVSCPRGQGKPEGDILPRGKVSPGTRYRGDKINRYTGTNFPISFRRPEVLKITAKMGVGFDIYVWKPAYAADR